jgi:ParB/RepB/Spo0J family partition protein
MKGLTTATIRREVTVSRDTRLSLIDPDPEQPRKAFDEVALAELAESMAANGLVVPILLRPVTAGRYMIVHGERRWRAAQRLGWETIPAEVRELTPDEAHWLSLVENVQRADLSPIEEARAYQERLAQGLTQAQLAQRVGKDRSSIAQKLRLLTLPAPVVTYLERRVLSEGHARQLLKLRQWLGENTTLTFEPPRHPIVREVHSDFDAEIDAWEEEVCASGWTVPSWKWAAFWWATVAVHQRQSVAQLAAALEDWYLDVCIAVCYFDLWRKARVVTFEALMPPMEREEADRLWWNMWGLLIGAGWLHLALKGSLPEGLRQRAYDRVRAYRTAQQN